MEAIDNKAGFTKVKNEVLSDNSRVFQPVRVVIINSPELMHPEIEDGDKSKPISTQPSWAANEPKPVPVIDAEYITNPRGPKR
jgi:hypothetical protein